MTARIAPFASSEHPTVREARLAIQRYAKALTPPYLFALALAAEQMATGAIRENWDAKVIEAAQHPEKFRKGGVR